MKNPFVSGMIPMFLSGAASAGARWGNTFLQDGGEPALKRVLVACAGAHPVLSAAAGQIVSGLKENARTTVTRIPMGQLAFVSPWEYDGVFMGIAPGEPGTLEDALAFIHDHRARLADIPFSLFFFQPRSNQSDAFVASLLSLVNPLDIRHFNLADGDVARRVSEWASATAWPLMETRWLADMVFPAPGLSACTAR